MLIHWSSGSLQFHQRGFEWVLDSGSLDFHPLWEQAFPQPHHRPRRNHCPPDCPPDACSSAIYVHSCIYVKFSALRARYTFLNTASAFQIKILTDLSSKICWNFHNIGFMCLKIVSKHQIYQLEAKLQKKEIFANFQQILGHFGS